MKNREEVDWFSSAMELVLRRNDHKGGWSEDDIWWLYARAVEELGEVGKALSDLQNCDMTNNNTVVFECVDVANFMMMIADKVNMGEVA